MTLFSVEKSNLQQPGPSWRHVGGPGIGIERSALALLEKLENGNLSDLSDLESDDEKEPDVQKVMHNEILTKDDDLYGENLIEKMDELIHNNTAETQWDFIADLYESQVEDENEEIEVAVAPKDITAENSERFSKAAPQKNKRRRNKKREEKPLPQGLTNKKDIKWIHGFHVKPPVSEWQEPNLEHITAPLDPIVYVRKYIPDDIFDLMVEMTNIYALQKGDANFKNTNKKELEVLFGLHIAMGVLKFPRIRLYWDKSLGLSLFINSMTRNRFFKLRSSLHLINNMEIDPTDTDTFKKVRPLINAFVNRCRELQTEKRLCIDEQVVPFKGHHSARMYNPKKPTPWGIKIFLLCGESGLIYDLIVYQGKTTEINRGTVDTFGLGASIVLHLAHSVTPGSELYFDNFFSTYHLFQMLTKKLVFSISTVRVDRFSKPPFMTIRELKDRGRGSMQEVTSEDKNVTLVRWNDNQPVTMASNFIGIGKTNTVTRWNKDEKTFVDVLRPDVIGLYNKSMGGVDKIDFLVAIYRTVIRSRKWPLRIIFHFVDLAICNSWLEYRKDCEICKVKQNMDLLHFRMSVANSLVFVGTTTPSRNRGRPRLEEEEKEIPETLLAARSETRPISAVRLDTVDHFPIHCNKKEAGRCKMTNCKGRSHFRCEKCMVYLCLSKDRNCFKLFHIS